MIKKYDSHIIAVVGTLIFMAIVFLLLWFLHMTMTPPMDDKDIEVTLEYIQDVEEAPEVEDLMDVAPPQQDESASQAQSKTQPTVAKPSDSKLLTQKIQKTLPTKEPTDTIVERTENVDVNKQKEKNAEFINDLFDSAQPGESEQKPSVDKPNKDQKNTDSENLGDISWRLEGRGNIKLPRPKKEHTQTCTVYIDVLVDENGDVKSATVSGKTITSDTGALEAAKSAAWQAKFTPGEGMVKGTITYKFIMK
ncbi:MAG: hypothetical protein UHD64_11230 [Bacteroidales bacterium]|nr:hypothetical protein [Bacteroidales bacterium]